MPSIKDLTVPQVKAQAPKWGLPAIGKALLEELADNPRSTVVAALLEARAADVAVKLQQADTPPPPPEPRLRRLGNLPADTGVIIVGDANQFDAHWTGTNPAPVGVYVEGDHDELEILKPELKRYEIETLPDGSWRITMKNVTEASVAKDMIQRHAVRRKCASVKVAVRGTRSGRSLAQDAARLDGTGFVQAGALKLASLRVPPNKQVPVFVDERGRLVIG